uniref:Uncharacterized protein n=1 Tax=Anguilla anguilla TaxID=7936 RepID=A0A0E9V9D7_ANGAN
MLFKSLVLSPLVCLTIQGMSSFYFFF